MTNNIQIFSYNNSNITFQLENGDVMVNATEMAKAFPNKRINDFVNLKQTKEFIQLLTLKTGISVLEIQHGGAYAGTWMHQKLALKFASWLSVDFEIWVYDHIEELLTTGSTSLVDDGDDALLARAVMVANRMLAVKNQELQAAKETIALQAPAVQYATDVLWSDSTYTTEQIAKEMGMSARTLNQVLRQKGVQFKRSDTWMLRAEHQGKGYTKTRTYLKYKDDGTQYTKMYTVWTEQGRKFIHDLLKV